MESVTHLTEMSNNSAVNVRLSRNKSRLLEVFTSHYGEHPLVRRNTCIPYRQQIPFIKSQYYDIKCLPSAFLSCSHFLDSLYGCNVLNLCACCIRKQFNISCIYSHGISFEYTWNMKYHLDMKRRRLNNVKYQFTFPRSYLIL